jgi:hypothetical protein
MRTLKVGILFLVGCASVEEKMRNLSVEYSISPQFNLDTVRTIAVFAKNDILYDAAVLNLLKVGKLDVVDRKRIDDILEEQEFGRSGFVDEKTAVEVGKLLGAYLIAFVEEVESKKDIVVSGYFSKVSVKIIEVQTGRILYLAVAEGISSAETKEESLRDACKSAFQPLIKKSSSTIK